VPEVLRRPLTAAALALALALGAPATALAQVEAPQVINPAVTKTSPREVVFTASVDPGGADTAVRLEFGATDALGARSDVVTVAAGDEPVLVTITLRGQPASTYFWRFRATNDAGSVVSETRTVETPAEARRKVMPVVRLSFAVETERSGLPLGRVLAFTRPGGLPVGTSLTVRCRRACTGKRTVRITSRTSSGRLVRFAEPLVVRPETVVEIRAVRAGWVGRVRTYRFQRSGGLLVPLRLSNRCLTPTSPPQRTSCSPG
jgi:hypothetical protein